MDFEPCFKVYNFVSDHPKSIKLFQTLLKTLPSFLRLLQLLSRKASLKNRRLFFAFLGKIRKKITPVLQVATSHCIL